ncbi:hypothetical protein Tco_0285363 [Tanacetum coccineum]
MQLHELMNLCTKLSDRVLTLETTKTTQSLEITSLKIRVKQLEKKASKRTHKFKRLYRVGSTRRVESSNDEGLGAQEDASKQERSIEDIDKDVEVSLVDKTHGRSDDTKMFNTDALIGDEVFAENDMTEKEHDVIHKEVSAAETLTTAGIKIPVSTAAPSTTDVSVQDKVEIAIDAIPLATKPPMTVEYKIVKEGQKGFYYLIRADGSSKRPEDDYERVFWGDLKVMFEPDIKCEVWRSLQGYKVTVWKLFDSCGVHFVRFKDLHIFILVEKRYPLTPITITNMLNKKL